MGEQKEKVNRFLPDKLSMTPQCFGFDSSGCSPNWTIQAKSGVSDSGCATNDKGCAPRLLQFRDPNGVSPQKLFNLRCPVVAALKQDHSRRRAARTGEAEKILISGYDGESVDPRIIAR